MAEHPKLTFFELKNSLILFSFNDLNGGDGGSRTRVHDISKDKSFTSLVGFYQLPTKLDGYNLMLTVLLH
tara:strand:- start:50 stop:259 length:210 start_codon:yes stop_codon:yes gene_type:complete